MILEEIAALYKLKMLPGEKIPEVAMFCIESQMESEAMLELAWENSPTLGDVAPIFEKGLLQLNIEIPTKERALLILTKIYCKQILSNEVSPFEGANKIWQVICTEDEAPELAFDFVTWADAIQNTGKTQDVQYFESLIKQKAKSIVETIDV